MRRPERPGGGQAAVAHPRDALDAGDLERLVEGRRWQDPRQAPREHGLARARWAHHQEVVTAGRRDLEPALGVLLAPDIREIQVLRRRRAPGTGTANRVWMPALVEEVGYAREARDRQDLDTSDQRGFGGILRGHDEALVTGVPGADGRGQGTAARAQHARQRQLSAHRASLKPVAWNLLARREQADGDREVEARPGLAQVGRSQIDR